jgi:hypothetical protein
MRPAMASEALSAIFGVGQEDDQAEPGGPLGEVAALLPS